jgi:hypothetical protein
MKTYQKKYLKWEEVDTKWEEVNMTWEEVFILIEVGEVIKRGGGAYAYVNGNPWDITKRELGEEKTEKFIRLYCRVNKEEYEEVIKTNTKIKVTVDKIQKVFNEGVKIGIKFNF